MSLIIDVFRDVVEKGFEFSAVHKFLHAASKFIFLLFVISFLHFLRFLGIPISISLAFPPSTYSLSFLALALLLLSIGLNYYRKASFSHILFENLSSTSIIDLRQYLPCEKGFDLFIAKDVTVKSAVKAFYNKITEALYRERSWKILVRVIKIKPIVILFVMIFIENLILLLTIYSALNALHISIDELVWLPLANLDPLLKAMLKTVVLLVLAFILEYLNISTIIPSTSGESAKEMLTVPLYITLYAILLEMEQPIRIVLSWKEKAIFTSILLLISSPWEPLLPTRKSEDITSPRPMKASFIFIPSPSMLIEKNSDIGNVFAEVCGKVFEKLGIARTGRPCIALLYKNKKKSKKRKDKKEVRETLY